MLLILKDDNFNSPTKLVSGLYPLTNKAGLWPLSSSPTRLVSGLNPLHQQDWSLASILFTNKTGLWLLSSSPTRLVSGLYPSPQQWGCNFVANIFYFLQLMKL